MNEKLSEKHKRNSGNVLIDSETEISIPEEGINLVDNIKKYSIDLESTRREIGRLYQIINNLSYYCNNLEDKIRVDRKDLTSNIMGLDEGKWVIDFEKKTIAKTVGGMPKTV